MDFLTSVSLEQLLWVVLLAPLAAAGVSAAFFRRSRWGAPVLACTASGVSLLAAVAALLKLPAGLMPLWEMVRALFFAGNGAVIPPLPVRMTHPWLRLGDFQVDIGFLVDANAALMLFVVTFTGFWIHIFSLGYMRDDAARGRFFTGLSVFMFSILGIVLAANLYMTFIFWELVGFSSYMLIAHYFDRAEASAAARKAFIVNRVGDLGFLAGIVLCGAHYGTVDFMTLGLRTVTDTAAGVQPDVLIAALLACGFLGKSAQFPLHVWLPDAMAGPTPVSALIHAATMVAAGVYFMARVFFLLPPPVLDALLWSCAAMALLAALCALAQTDIKKSLAYSTLSHLGLMGAAIGLGAPGVALAHLAMHAFFKAALFLGAGSVIHACHHEQDMTRMGGLARRMPLTFATFAVAGASLCAVPFTAGWRSKEAILATALGDGRVLALGMLLLAGLGSALYTGRMVRMVFFDTARGEAAGHARENSAWMCVPLLVLGVVYSLLAGAVPLAPALADGQFTAHTPGGAGHGDALPLAIASALLALGGIAAAFWFYGRTAGADALRARAPRIYAMLEFRWMDALYDTWITRVQNPLCNAVAFFDTLFINGLAVRGGGAGIPALLGYASRRLLHTGNARATLWWLALGALLCTGAMVLC